MTTRQVPLGSGFGARTTAAQVVEGVDLTGRRALVTGGYSGLGLETVRALAGAGAEVVVPARRPDVARAALDDAGLDRVEVGALDLADLASVRACAEGLLAAGRPLDLLVANAAVMACPETRVGPGWEAQLATNHVGHHVLTGLLWPLLAERGARVVVLSSTGHKLSAFRHDDPWFATGYDKWQAYGQAKTANSLFAVHLDALGAPHGVRALAVHPGGILTPLQRHLPHAEMVAAGWISEDGTPHERFKTPEQGAATTVWAATSRQLDGLGGVYCEDVDVAAPTEPGPTARVRGVDAHAVDPAEAERVWAWTADLTGVDPVG